MVRHLFGNGVLGVLMLVGVITVQPAHAGELNRGWVHAEAQWLMHVDVDRLVASEIGQYIIEHPEQFDIDMGELEHVREETGLDPLKDIHGITLYGRGDPDDKKVGVIARTSAKVDDLVQRMQEEGGDHYHSMTFDGIDFHVWDEHEDSVLLHVREADEPGRRIAVIGQNPQVLAHVIAVIDGDEPSVATVDDALLRARPQDGSLIYLEASAMPWLGKGGNPASKIARCSDHISLDVAERDENVELRLSISAKSEDDARNISQVVQGLIALGRLMADEKPELRPLMDMTRGLAITSHERDIRVNAQYATETVIRAIRSSRPNKGHSDDDGDEDQPEQVPWPRDKDDDARTGASNGEDGQPS